MGKPSEINQTICFEQWKLCVQMANSVSQRRDTMNNLFVSINVAIVAGISIIKWDLKSLLIIAAGLALCILWLLCIKNYYKLNQTKYEIIQDLEKDLGYQPFTIEWNKLKHENNYKSGTFLEKFLPIIFILLYLISTLLIIIVSCLTKSETGA